MASFLRRFFANAAGLGGLLVQRLGVAISDDYADEASHPTLTAGTGAPSATEPNGSRYLRTNGVQYRRVGGAWEATESASATTPVADPASLAVLAATTNGDGASKIGIEDAAASITGATVEAALAELSARVGQIIIVPELTAGVEGAGAANAIDVTINLTDLLGTAVSRVQHLECRVYDASMLESVVGDITMAEVGAGAEVSTTARPALLISTDANGDAVVRVTDVSGVLAGTVHLVVTPVQLAGGSRFPGIPCRIALTFA